jgi:hypothetical protein
MAVAICKDIAKEQGSSIPLDRALELVALAATREPEAYDAWACRWLARWLSEAPDATIDGAADVAAALAELPAEPTALDSIRPRGRRT